MCTQTSSKVPSLNQFLVMTTAEILELPVNQCQPSELYKWAVYGIAHQIDHPVTNQILALKYFVNRFDYSSERTELYDVVVPKLKESLCELLQSSQLDTICSLINSVALTICDTVDLTCDDSEALQSLAIGVLDLLLQLYKLSFERTKSQRDDGIALERLQSIVGIVDVIRAKLLDHLKRNEANYLPDDFTQNDVMFVNRLIVLLCEMAEFAHKAAEASFLVAVWRCIVGICVGKLPKSIERLAANCDESNCFEFLLSAVKQGCLCIQYGLEEIRQSSSEQTGKFHNRSIAFVTVVFQRLATVYSHDKFRGHNHVLATVLTMMRTLRTHSPPNAFLNQELASSLQNVLLLICKSDEFVECLYRTSSDEFPTELLHVGLAISKKLLNDADSDFLRYFMKSEDANIVGKLVECLSTDPSPMFDEGHPVYAETIETLASILIKCSTVPLTVNPNVIPRLLVKNLLQSDNILAGYIWLDLWNAWLRCLSEEQCYNLILFWSEINDKQSAVQSNDLTSVHVRILLRNLYDSLTDSYKLKLSSGKSVLSNTKLWVTLGLQRRECDAVQITNVHTKIDQLLKTFLAARSDAAFYKLIKHLRLLETMPQSNATPVPDYLIELWNLNLNHRPKKYSPLIITLIRISITYHRCLSNGQHLQILRKLSAIEKSPMVIISIQLEVLHYLRHVAVSYFTVEYQKGILQTIRQLFNKSFVNSDPIVRKAAFIAYARVISEAKHEDIHPDNITDNENVKMELFDFMKAHKSTRQIRRDHKIRFLQELSLCSIQHECSGASVPPSDDSLRDSYSNEMRMKEIIERMRGDTKELMALNCKFRLTEELCKNIASIRLELASLE